MARLVAYAGTNHRLRRTLARMRAGKPVKMATLGGSVSAGHGIRGQGSEKYAPSNLNVRVFSWLNQTFPAAGGSAFNPKEKKDNVNVYTNGAEPARASDYFSMCHGLHIADDTELIIVELAINDQPGLEPEVNQELLLRQLLEMESQPAVLLFNVFGLVFDQILVGGDLTYGVAQFYDTPALSLRNMLLPHIVQNKTHVVEYFNHEHNMVPDPDTFVGVDLRHIGTRGHELSGDLIIAYLELQLAEMDAAEAAAGLGWSIDSLYPIPPLFPGLLAKKFNPAMPPVPAFKPSCFAAHSDIAPLAPSKQNGWRKWAWKDKTYLVADEPGASFEYELSLNHGSIVLYYLRSREFGLGNLGCEVVGQSKRRKIQGYWNSHLNIGQSQHWEHLPPGNHTFKCTLLSETDDPKNGTEFRLMALMTI
ncbi:hypothetical protein VHUM_00242 [Vanrija humicola]|uniref:SGNH hydrolase-type esterase domain-containing protein n=1 Tax=Vanrija humicola TaxID=5417 RepID=A0A7D8Z3V6_VANHU|nr:hypothetical protein VHUM_00242 [Vanrija humicola]